MPTSPGSHRRSFSAMSHRSSFGGLDPFDDEDDGIPRFESRSPSRPRPAVDEKMYNAMEAEQESITLDLIKRLERLKAEKVELEVALEAEGEQLVNRLLRMQQQQQSLQQVPVPSESGSVSATSPPASAGSTMGFAAREPGGDLGIEALRVENETLKMKLLDADRELKESRRLGEGFRVELVELRRRLNIPLDDLVGLPSPSLSPSHHRRLSSSPGTRPLPAAGVASSAAQLRQSSNGGGSGVGATPSVPIPTTAASYHHKRTSSTSSPSASFARTSTFPTPISSSAGSSFGLSLEEPFGGSGVASGLERRRSAHSGSNSTYLTSPSTSAATNVNRDTLSLTMPVRRSAAGQGAPGSRSSSVDPSSSSGLPYPPVPPNSLVSPPTFGGVSPTSSSSWATWGGRHPHQKQAPPLSSTSATFPSRSHSRHGSFSSSSTSSYASVLPGPGIAPGGAHPSHLAQPHSSNAYGFCPTTSSAENNPPHPPGSTPAMAARQRRLSQSGATSNARVAETGRLIKRDSSNSAASLKGVEGGAGAGGSGADDAVLNVDDKVPVSSPNPMSGDLENAVEEETDAELGEEEVKTALREEEAKAAGRGKGEKEGAEASAE